MAKKITVLQNKIEEKSVQAKMYELTVANIQNVGNKSYGYASYLQMISFRESMTAPRQKLIS